VLIDIMKHISGPEDQAKVLRARSRNKFVRKEFTAAIQDILQALQILGLHSRQSIVVSLNLIHTDININADVTMEEADVMFEQVKNMILATGSDQILTAKRATDPKIDLAVALLNDAGLPATFINSAALTHFRLGMSAYWAGTAAFPTVLGLTVRVSRWLAAKVHYLIQFL
jgi:hypothetical protein